MAGAGYVEVVAGPGAGDEQDAAFLLQVLRVRGSILGFRADRGWVRDQAPLDAEAPLQLRPIAHLAIILWLATRAASHLTPVTAGTHGKHW